MLWNKRNTTHTHTHISHMRTCTDNTYITHVHTRAGTHTRKHNTHIIHVHTCACTHSTHVTHAHACAHTHHHITHAYTYTSHMHTHKEGQSPSKAGGRG